MSINYYSLLTFCGKVNRKKEKGMDKYSSFISPTRRNMATPRALVENGIAHFGTFDKEFEILNILDCQNPTALGNFFKKKKLTLWEAMEVNLTDGYLLAVCCDMGIFGLGFNVFYDKATKKVYSWTTNVKSKDTKIAENLMGGKESSIDCPEMLIRYINNFEKGEVTVDGHQGDSSSGKIEYHFDLKALSKASIVSIPFGKNRPLCTEKQFFKADGYLNFNGKEYKVDESTVAVIDDHRAYYPRHAHYDWLTSMGKKGDKYMAFNLTANQSTDPTKYNENLIWKEGSSSLLPPVHFIRNRKTIDFVSETATPTVWEIKDDNDMVNLKFYVTGVYKDHENHAGVVQINYFVAFGKLEGYVRDENGTLYDYTGEDAMGEDKTLLL